MIEFLVIIALIWIIFAVVQDVKSREIANWLNFSLIVFALAIRLFYSVFSGNYNYIIFGLLGLGIFFILSNLFYYGRVFAGGDAKLLMALGPILPIASTFYQNILIFIIFVISLLLLGAIYSIFYSATLVLVNRARFVKEFKARFYKSQRYFIVIIICSFIILGLAFYLQSILLAVLALFVFSFPFLYVYTKSIEQAYMMVYTASDKITIGDWIAETIVVHGRVIHPDWEGLNEQQVDLIKKYYKKKILVKQGIPFSPSFLFAFFVILIIQYYFNGNWAFFGLI